MEKVDIPAYRSIIEAEKQELRKRRAEVSADLLAKMAAEAILEKSGEPGVGAIRLQHSELRQKYASVDGAREVSADEYRTRANLFEDIFELQGRDAFETSCREWLESLGFSCDVVWNGNGSQWKAVDNPRSFVCRWKVVAKPRT